MQKKIDCAKSVPIKIDCHKARLSRSELLSDWSNVNPQIRSTYIPNRSSSVKYSLHATVESNKISNRTLQMLQPTTRNIAARNHQAGSTAASLASMRYDLRLPSTTVQDYRRRCLVWSGLAWLGSKQPLVLLPWPWFSISPVIPLLPHRQKVRSWKVRISIPFALQIVRQAGHSGTANHTRCSSSRLIWFFH